MKNKTYDTLKWIAMYLLPGLATLYFTIGGIWGLPNVEQVVGTITALDAFLGGLLGIASKQYKDGGMDGILNITSNEDNLKYDFVFTRPFDNLADSEMVILKVEKDKVAE